MPQPGPRALPAAPRTLADGGQGRADGNRHPKWTVRILLLSAFGSDSLLCKALVFNAGQSPQEKWWRNLAD